MTDESAFTVVIQAGGQSSRMGQDKALMPFLGRPLIERLVGRLSGLADELLVTTNHLQDYTFLNQPLVPDVFPGHGALGGLYTALCASRCPFVAIVACDMPFVRSDLLQVERDLLVREGVDVVVPRSPNGLEPFHAVYRRETCLPHIRAALEAGENKVISWFFKVQVREMLPDEIAIYDPSFLSFFNVNSPDEFHRAEDLARASE